MKRIICGLLSALLLVSVLTAYSLADEGTIESQNAEAWENDSVDMVDTNEVAEADEESETENENQIMDRPVQDEITQSVEISSETEEDTIEDNTGDESIYEDEAASLEEYLAVSGYSSDFIEIVSDVRICSDTVIPTEGIWILSSGTVTVEEGSTLVNEGLLIVCGGELHISVGAKLSNLMFIEVNGDGKLFVEEDGKYITENGAVLRLNNAEAGCENANITGIDKGSIEWALFAGSKEELQEALQKKYGFLNVFVSDPELVLRIASEDLRKNVSISLVVK